MNELTVIYRACNSELTNIKSIRPPWFSKFRSFKSFWDSFGGWCDIKVVFDGEKSEFSDYIESFCSDIQFISCRDNQKSLLYCYELARSLDTRLLYFLEDDFLHSPSSLECMLDTLLTGYDPFTLFDHPDRYNIHSSGLYIGNDMTLGKEIIGRTIMGYHVRTAISTTCTFACSKKLFLREFDYLVKFCEQGHGAPEDHKYWVNFTKRGGRLWTAIPSLATHVSNPLPIGNWETLNNYIKL